MNLIYMNSTGAGITTKTTNNHLSEAIEDHLKDVKDYVDDRNKEERKKTAPRLVGSHNRGENG